MVSQYEASMLQRAMRHELEGANRAVAKCAAGLVFLAVIAAVGTYLAPSRPAVDMAAAPVVEAGSELTPLPELE